LLVVTTTICFMLALTLGGGKDGWRSPLVIALLASAATMGTLFAWRLRRIAEPLIPLDVLANRVVLTATGSVFFAMAAFISLSVYIPLFLELVLRLSPSWAGLALVGYMIGTVIGANLAARTMVRFQHYKRMPLIGLGVSALCLGALAWFAPVIGVAETELLLIVAGIASGMQFPVTTVSVQNAVDPRDMGVATSVLAFLRSLGSAIGVAAIGAVGAASGIVVGRAEGGALDASSTIAAHGSQFTPVFAAAAMSLVLSFCSLLMMEERPLRGPQPQAEASAA
jgi:predicted MFS family arabinose efflux permease